MPKSTCIVQPQTAKVATVEPVSQEKQAVQDLETKLESIGIDSTVLHKKFGKGTVVKINKNEKFIHIKFTLGEKKFIFPDAFQMGFLGSVEKSVGNILLVRLFSILNILF